MPDTPSYISLKLAQAPKTGPRSTGKITYRILTDPDYKCLFLTLVSNDSSGWFSTEIVPLARIEELLSQAEPGLPIRVKQIGAAFKSRSVNNGCFAFAALRAENLIGLTAHANHQYVVSDDWELWKSVMLTEPGEPYVPPAPKGLALPKKNELPVTSNVPEPVPVPESSNKRKPRKTLVLKSRPEVDDGSSAETATDASTAHPEQPQHDDAEPEQVDADIA